MRRLVALGLLMAGPAQAQNPPALPPVISPATPPAAAPVIPPATAPAVPPPPLETWLPRTGVELAGLDKITARMTVLNGKIGQPINFGTLVVTVRSCLVRGPDQPQDQAAFLDVTDSRNPSFSFHGWMLLSAPGDTVIEHPVYDVRLTACRG